MALFALTTCWAISQRKHSLDMSAGTPEYKRSLGAREHQQWELSLARSAAHSSVLRKLNALDFYARRLPLYLRFIMRRWK